jgi:hypothetical protein
MTIPPQIHKEAPFRQRPHQKLTISRNTITKNSSVMQEEESIAVTFQLIHVLLAHAGDPKMANLITHFSGKQSVRFGLHRKTRGSSDHGGNDH